MSTQPGPAPEPSATTTRGAPTAAAAYATALHCLYTAVEQPGQPIPLREIGA